MTATIQSISIGSRSDLTWIGGSLTIAEDSTVETTCRWTTNRNFIVRSFRVYIADQVDFEGTQLIGWDPSAETIRSWVFDSDGAFGVGRWSGGDGRGTVPTLRVLADGRRATATHVFELLDENTVRFRSVGRQVGGELLPNIEPIVVRKIG